MTRSDLIAALNLLIRYRVISDDAAHRFLLDLEKDMGLNDPSYIDLG